MVDANHMAFRERHSTIRSCCVCLLFLFTMVGLGHHRKSSDVSVRDPLDSFPLAICLKKSVLFHRMLCVFALLLRPQKRHAKYVQAGTSIFTSSPSLHTFVGPRKKYHRTSLIHLCTSTPRRLCSGKAPAHPRPSLVSELSVLSKIVVSRGGSERSEACAVLLLAAFSCLLAGVVSGSVFNSGASIERRSVHVPSGALHKQHKCERQADDNDNETALIGRILHLGHTETNHTRPSKLPIQDNKPSCTA